MRQTTHETNALTSQHTFFYCVCMCAYICVTLAIWPPPPTQSLIPPSSKIQRAGRGVNTLSHTPCRRAPDTWHEGWDRHVSSHGTRHPHTHKLHMSHTHTHVTYVTHTHILPMLHTQTHFTYVTYYKCHTLSVSLSLDLYRRMPCTWWLGQTRRPISTMCGRLLTAKIGFKLLQMRGIYVYTYIYILMRCVCVYIYIHV